MKPIWDYAVADHGLELGLCEPDESGVLTPVHHWRNDSFNPLLCLKNEQDTNEKTRKTGKSH